MNIESYISSLPLKRKLSDVKEKILVRLWGSDSDTFPKPWVSSDELLELTQQKYFDRRTRELRGQLGCNIESEYRQEFGGHGWRLVSTNLSLPQEREYLTQQQKLQLFERHDYHCSTCGIQVEAGVRGLQADHKVPLSKGGSNDLVNWQPMCNNCNVGKRRACEGCQLECKQCSWAFPETIGVKTMISLKENTIRRVETYSSNSAKTFDSVMDEAANYYIDRLDGKN